VIKEINKAWSFS